MKENYLEPHLIWSMALSPIIYAASSTGQTYSMTVLTVAISLVLKELPFFLKIISESSARVGGEVN